MPRLLLKRIPRSIIKERNIPIQSASQVKLKIFFPNSNDVLSGRGKHNYCHYGNIYFLHLVKQYQLKYVICPKHLKPKVANDIYAQLRQLDPPSRFLKACSENKNKVAWHEMSYKESLEKIRHAMRDNEARVLKRNKPYAIQNVLQVKDRNQMTNKGHSFIATSGCSDQACLPKNNNKIPIVYP